MSILSSLPTSVLTFGARRGMPDKYLIYGNAVCSHHFSTPVCCRLNRRAFFFLPIKILSNPFFCSVDYYIPVSNSNQQCITDRMKDVMQERVRKREKEVWSSSICPLPEVCCSGWATEWRSASPHTHTYTKPIINVYSHCHTLITFPTIQTITSHHYTVAYLYCLNVAWEFIVHWCKYHSYGWNEA